MDRLYQQGKITYVGSNNFSGLGDAQANKRALNQQRMGLVCEQGLYNLIERRAELEVLTRVSAVRSWADSWSPLAEVCWQGTAAPQADANPPQCKKRGKHRLNNYKRSRLYARI